ncbi:MAG: acyltransferase [Candidatus Hodarchaeales archaeon]
MIILILNGLFLFLASFIGLTIYEGLSGFPIYLRIPLTLVLTYFTLIFMFLIIDGLSRLILRNSPEVLAPRTFKRLVWGIGAISRKNYLHLLQGLALIAGQSNLAMRFLGLRHGKGFTLISSRINEPSRVKIGKNVLIGTDATIGSSFHPFQGKVDRRQILIGSNCLIGGRSVIQNGVQICDNVVVAVLSFVPSGSVLESGWVYGGVPAKKIQPLQPK